MEKEMKEINVILGTRLRRKRKICGYTRESLSEKIDVSPRFLADIEAGKVGVSLTTLKSICRVLNVSADYLLGLTQPDEVDEDMITLISCINDLEHISVKYAPQILRTLDEAVHQAKSI